MTAFYIIIAILIFGILIIIHEFGHFTAAKLCGVKVNEFAVGMGPALVKKQKGETLFTVRSIPFGGFCAMAGVDEESDDPRAFTSQSAWKRIIILCAGSFNNFLLGLIIVMILYSSAEAFYAPVIGEFMEGCPYESEELLQVGDRFLKINGRRVYQLSNVNEFLSADEDGTYDLVIRRDGKRIKLNDIRLEKMEYEGREGKYIGLLFNAYDDGNFVNVIRYSWNTCMDFGRMIWQSLGQLIHGKVKADDLSGPVGIVDLMAETGEQAETVSDGLYSVFYLAAFIAVNLAIMNMLPIPALDGGRVFLLIVTVIIEAITKKKLDPKYEGYVHAAGLILLLALMAFIMFNDIYKLIKG